MTDVLNGANSNNNNNITIKIENKGLIEDTNIQRLPFNLGYNGFAKVSNYFNVTEKSVENYVYSAFRGVPLVGEKLNVPVGFDGYVFRDEKDDDKDDNDHNGNKQWEPISKFNNITYWNRETIPSDFDKPVQALKSLSILSMVNKEITKEDIENELKSNKTNNQGVSSMKVINITTTTTTTSTSSTPDKKDIKKSEKDEEKDEEEEEKDERKQKKSKEI